MPLASRSSESCAKMQTTLSTWTPLNHPRSNSKVFEERRDLLAKWFGRWTDSQRRAVLQDFVQRCSSEQLLFLSLSVSGRLPLQAADFTCLLPRALSLYLFSFLDPRSLSRCARVSWHWRSIVELDQLWMPKCLKFGWCIDFSPTAFEQGVWKRLYIQTVQELQTAWTHRQLCVSAPSSRYEDLSEEAVLREEPAASRRKPPTAPPPPWRDADRHPKDTLRFNYLDNLEATERDLHLTSACNAPKPQRTPSEAGYKLRKAKSLVKRSSDHDLLV